MIKIYEIAHISNKRAKLVLAFLFFLIFFSATPFNVLVAKEYQYDSIVTKIQINRDTTFDVEEQQTFSYRSNFHKGWRSLKLDKISLISDIVVIDGVSKQPLVFSGERLNEFDSSSLGKFTSWSENNHQNIEWYYDLTDTTHLWIIKYKVHGGLGFFKDHDELYWNLFNDYQVPVISATAFVFLPVQANKIGDLQSNIYANIKNFYGLPKSVNNLLFTSSFQIDDNKTFSFQAENIPPREPVTIYAGWPKGIVDQSAFWLDFLKIYLGYFLSLIIILLSFLIGFFYWYFTECHQKGRGTIIPQYEPPQFLRPALAEVVVRERITGRAWPATVVDLAVRGYLRISEDKTKKKYGIVEIIFSIIFGLAFFSPLALLLFLLNTASANQTNVGFLLIFQIIILLVIFKKHKEKDYLIELGNKSFDDPELEDYEKKFLKILFFSKNSFSTEELKKSSRVRKQGFYLKMQKLKDDLYQEKKLAKVFEKSPMTDFSTEILILSLVVLILVILPIISQNHFLLVTITGSLIFLCLFIRYEARLSREGAILRDDWLGFKLYLETAERYRMQNLTPEIFEKYLPYAIIFGVEKKWGKAFNSFNMKAPNWYSGSTSFSGGSNSFSSDSFSPAIFSSSFSSSLSSAFANSGAGGGGGGGSAGGGGGGGGGGAS